MIIKTEAEQSVIVSMKQFKNFQTPMLGNEVVATAIERLIDTMRLEYGAKLGEVESRREILAARDRLVARGDIEAQDGDGRFWRMIRE
jgi:hypothetical protein